MGPTNANEYLNDNPTITISLDVGEGQPHVQDRRRVAQEHLERPQRRRTRRHLQLHFRRDGSALPATDDSEWRLRRASRTPVSCWGRWIPPGELGPGPTNAEDRPTGSSYRIRGRSRASSRSITACVGTTRRPCTRWTTAFPNSRRIFRTPRPAVCWARWPMKAPARDAAIAASPRPIPMP